MTEVTREKQEGHYEYENVIHVPSSNSAGVGCGKVTYFYTFDD